MACFHFQGIQFAKSLQDMGGYSSTKCCVCEEKTRRIFCFGCHKVVCERCWKQHFERDMEAHAFYLTFQGVFICLRCDQSVCSYDLGNKHHRAFLHLARAEFRCEMALNFGVLSKQTATVSWITNQVDAESYAQKFAYVANLDRAEVARLQNVNVQGYKNAICKYAVHFRYSTAGINDLRKQYSLRRRGPSNLDQKSIRNKLHAAQMDDVADTFQQIDWTKSPKIKDKRNFLEKILKQPGNAQKSFVNPLKLMDDRHAKVDVGVFHTGRDTLVDLQENQNIEETITALLRPETDHMKLQYVQFSPQIGSSFYNLIYPKAILKYTSKGTRHDRFLWITHPKITAITTPPELNAFAEMLVSDTAKQLSLTWAPKPDGQKIDYDSIPIKDITAITLGRHTRAFQLFDTKNPIKISKQLILSVGNEEAVTQSRRTLDVHSLSIVSPVRTLDFECPDANIWKEVIEYLCSCVLYQ